MLVYIRLRLQEEIQEYIQHFQKTEYYLRIRHSLKFPADGQIVSLSDVWMPEIYIESCIKTTKRRIWNIEERVRYSENEALRNRSIH